MTVDPLLLLPLLVSWPLLLAFLSLIPGFGPLSMKLLPLGPIPALAAVLWVPRNSSISMPGVLLDGGLVLSEIGVVFVASAAVLWFLAGIYAGYYLREDNRQIAFALFWNLGGVLINETARVPVDGPVHHRSPPRRVQVVPATAIIPK